MYCHCTDHFNVADSTSMAPTAKSVNVYVRVRPPTGPDGESPRCTLLQLEPGTVAVGKSGDQRVAKSYGFDGVFGAGVSQVG